MTGTPEFDSGLDAAQASDGVVDATAGIDTELDTAGHDVPARDEHDGRLDDASDASNAQAAAQVVDDDEAASYDDGPGGGTLFAVPPRQRFDSLPEPEATGDARIDAATARLAELADLPSADQVAVYDDVHGRLRDALADAEVT